MSLPQDKITGTVHEKYGKLYMVFSFPQADGSRKRKWEATGLPVRGNKRRAERLLEDRLNELNREFSSRQNETTQASNKPLFPAAMKDWLDGVMVNVVRESTHIQYIRAYNKHILPHKPFEIPVDEVTPYHVQTFYNQKFAEGLAGESVKKIHANIHKFLDYCVDMDLIAFNPSDRVKLPKRKQYEHAEPYSAEQLNKLSKIFRGDPIETAVVITCAYGLRRSEVLGLKFDAVDFEKGTITIKHTVVPGKNGYIYADQTKSRSSRRTLPLTDNMRKYIQQLQAEKADNKALFGNQYYDSPYICTRPDGYPLHPDYVSARFRKVLERSDLPLIRFHDLRHSVVNVLRQNKHDPKDIQAWLGHSDVSTTLNIYSHLLEEDMSDMGKVLNNVTPKFELQPERAEDRAEAAQNAASSIDKRWLRSRRHDMAR